MRQSAGGKNCGDVSTNFEPRSMLASQSPPPTSRKLDASESEGACEAPAPYTLTKW